MASTTALFTGLSGLNAHARDLDVIGNNIANVNTTAFKSSRLMFQTQFSRTLSEGTEPSGFSGGTNPSQVGLGVSTAGVQRNLSQGSVSATGDQRDLAIEGEGYFVVDRGEDRLFTRAGAFRQNENDELTTITGERLKGFGIDEDFNIQTGELVDVVIPVGSMTLAQATENVRFSGNLNAAGSVATQGASIDLMGTETAGLSVIAGATVPPTPPNVLEPASLLTEIEDPEEPGSGTPLFAAGQRIEVSGAEKGGKVLPDASLAVGATTTVQELMDFLDEAMGLLGEAGANPDGATPGVGLDPATGVVTVTGNTGTVNDLELEAGDVRLLDSSGAFVRSPFVTSKTAAADGESVRTAFVAFDSLGNSVTSNLSMVLEGADATGTTWRWFAESADDSDLDLSVGTGQLTFDNFGQLSSGSPPSISIDREGTGAASPLTMSLEFGAQDGVTALADVESEIASPFQDGAPIGTLSGFSVGDDGVITGTFTNGLTRSLGQVALASFANPEGLVDEGNSLFGVGANSGDAVIGAPGQFGSGRIVSGALELSNVDLGQEFIDLILASTGYSASSRVIRTTDELMQQLLVLGR